MKKRLLLLFLIYHSVLQAQQPKLVVEQHQKRAVSNYLRKHGLDMDSLMEVQHQDVVALGASKEQKRYIIIPNKKHSMNVGILASGHKIFDYYPEEYVHLISKYQKRSKQKEKIVISDLPGSYIVEMLHKAKEGIPYNVIEWQENCIKGNHPDSLSTEPGHVGETNFEARFNSWDWKGKSSAITNSEEYCLSPRPAGLRRKVQLKIEKLFHSLLGNTSEFAGIEIWIKLNANKNSFPKGKAAQWIVQSYLELMGNVVADSGQPIQKGIDRVIIAKDLLEKDSMTHSKLWYALRTMESVLAGADYVGEVDEISLGKTKEMVSLNGLEFDWSDKPRVLVFRNDNQEILVVWSPNSTGAEGQFELSFRQALQAVFFEKCTIVTPRDCDEDGYHRSFDYEEPFVFGAKTVPVTETPMYVILDYVGQDEAPVDCPDFKMTEATKDSITFEWEVFYSKNMAKTMDIYYETSAAPNSQFDLANPNLHLAVKGVIVNSPSKSITLKGLDYSKEMAFYVVAKKNKDVVNICKIE